MKEQQENRDRMVREIGWMAIYLVVVSAIFCLGQLVFHGSIRWK